ncbi:MAG: hypothetical protein KF730_04525 [Sphingomonas sp.]|uniref:hypothetical protein n=1 Tax=Sphingomonas sp. TaxID=28214 RepID=UPI0025CED73A|nr:hypothetical protein [Sphingomonas sp.]MBX3563825.1 hypothetical protein [Sphingomonas sp.]
MKWAGKLLLALLMVAYAMIWTGLALVMLFSREWPTHWVGWAVIIANPLLLATVAGLFERYRQKGSYHG